jgi:SAM-dependent methyltransferase
MAWFETEDFWRDLYPYMFSAERFAGATDEVSRILDLTGVQSGTLLDLCCGPGRHSVEFARRGFTVTGVDRTPYLLDQARVCAETAMFELVNQDMREFRRPGAFDLAVNVFTSFGYFENPGDDLRVLRNVFDSLRPGGVFLMELLGKECLAARYVPSRCYDFPDGTMLVQRARVENEWTRVFCEWTIIRSGQARTHRFDHAIYSGRELKDLLLQAGFAGVRLYGNLLGAPYGTDAQRLVAVARR